MRAPSSRTFAAIVASSMRISAMSSAGNAARTAVTERLCRVPLWVVEQPGDASERDECERDRAVEEGLTIGGNACGIVRPRLHVRVLHEMRVRVRRRCLARLGNAAHDDLPAHL